MPNESAPIEITLTSRFRKNLKKLSKRYRLIRSDLEPLISQLQSGKLPGDQIVGSGLTLFKVRLKNSNIQKGKSAGYRVVYYTKTKEKITLVTIYSKSDRADVSVSEVEAILTEDKIG